MDIKYLGTEYGGWTIDIDHIQNGDVVIDAGIGEDASFLHELLKYRDVSIIGVDPTKKSHDYISKNPISRMEFLKKAIAKHGTDEIEMFKNNNPDHVSESCYSDHSSTAGNESYFASCISFRTLIDKYSPSLIKMDIEGSEYDVLHECIGIKQICVEFHHHCIPSRSIHETEKCVNVMIENGYEVISIKNNREYTFVLKN